MFPDQDRCPFYGCVCWLSSCSDRERQEEREKEGGGQHSESVGGKIRKERSWKIDRNEERRKICILIAGHW